MSLTNRLIVRAERRARELRPATLIYAGKEIPCTPGNLTFFERLRAGGGGFQGYENVFVKVLRCDLPSIPVPGGNGAMAPIVFKRGQPIQLRNDDPDNPIPGETFDLRVGENNQSTTTVLMLNLENPKA